MPPAPPPLTQVSGTTLALARFCLTFVGSIQSSAPPAGPTGPPPGQMYFWAALKFGKHRENTSNVQFFFQIVKALRWRAKIQNTCENVLREGAKGGECEIPGELPTSFPITSSPATPFDALMAVNYITCIKTPPNCKYFSSLPPLLTSFAQPNSSL